MSPRIQRLLQPAEGVTSRVAGTFLWQLDDLNRRLTLDTRGATAEELAWQSAPGMNTIGMLLAHVAVIEVGWIQVAVLRFDRWEEERVLGVPHEAFGMPLPEDGAPPALLQGKDLAYFDDLLERARVHTREALAPLSDDDVERTFERPRPNGDVVEANVGWVLYHLVEHLAGHYGQILMLRHQHRALAGRR
jgi:uncharacterized damage-inducible protein DinB